MLAAELWALNRAVRGFTLSVGGWQTDPPSPAYANVASTPLAPPPGGGNGGNMAGASGGGGDAPCQPSARMTQEESVTKIRPVSGFAARRNAAVLMLKTGQAPSCATQLYHGVDPATVRR